MTKGYKEHTIGELIQAIKQTVQDTPYLDINSPVMISDYNMSGMKYEFDILPSFSSKHHTAGLCLFHSLGEEAQEVEVRVEAEEVAEEKETSVMKFAKWFKE